MISSADFSAVLPLKIFLPVQDPGGDREEIKLLTSLKGSIIISVTCERGGTGRRTGFRILRLVHKGSSPFARTRDRGFHGLLLLEEQDKTTLSVK